MANSVLRGLARVGLVLHESYPHRAGAALWEPVARTEAARVKLGGKASDRRAAPGHWTLPGGVYARATRPPRIVAAIGDREERGAERALDHVLPFLCVEFGFAGHELAAAQPLTACDHQSVIDVTHFTDPGCPWAYSAWPAHTTLRWRYGAQLRWTPVMIGLTEDAAQYAARGYTPTRSAIGYGRFRRFGMPFQITPKARLSATSPPAARSWPRDWPRRRSRTPRCGRCSSHSSLQPAPWTIPTPCARRSRASRALTPTLSWGGSTIPRSWPPTRPTALARARRRDRPPSSRAGRRTPTARCVTPRRRWSSMALTGRGWKPVAFSRRGLRRPYRQPGPHSRAASTRRGPSRSAERLPLHPDDGRGGCRDGRAPRRTQLGRRRGRAHRGHRRGTRRSPPAGDGSLWALAR